MSEATGFTCKHPELRLPLRYIMCFHPRILCDNEKEGALEVAGRGCRSRNVGSPNISARLAAAAANIAPTGG